MKRVFSGIRPSGDLHIGNYLGAIKQWVKLQDDHEVVFGIMDEHAITTPHEPDTLRKNTLETAMLYIAAGLDPKKVTLMVQSQVPAHAELAWILGTMTPLGELERMAQFKEKAGLEKIVSNVPLREELVAGFKKQLEMGDKTLAGKDFEAESEKIEKFLREHAEKTYYELRAKTNAGLLNYPVLMAADILLYQTDAVPVGEDQVQHVELARSVAERFNNRYGQTFTIPEAMIQKETARIMSLDDPTKKMSKSGESERGYILLTDPPDAIREKIKAAVTDSGTEITYDPDAKPAVSNLLVIFSEFSGRSIAELERAYAGKPYAEFKADLAEAVVNCLAPLQKKFKELKKDRAGVLKILRDGSEKAAAIANQTLADVKEKIGFLVP